MEKKSLATGQAPQIKIARLDGSLRITGWEQAEIQAKTNGDLLELTPNGDTVSINCDDDLILQIPQDSGIEIASLADDLSIRGIQNGIKLADVGGDTSLRDVGDVECSKIGGDLSVRGAASFKAASVSGDVSLRNITGDAKLAGVGGDLHLRNIQGSLNATTGEDAVLNIEPQEGASYKISAGGDVFLQLPEDANAELKLSAGKGLSINLPGVEEEKGSARSLTLGLGAAKIAIVAGGSLRVSTAPEHSLETPPLPFAEADFSRIEEFAERISQKFDDFPDDFAERISKEFDDFPEKLGRKISLRVESSQKRAEEKMRRAEEKIRKAEGKIRKAEKKIKMYHFSPENWGSKTSAKKNVSEDERMLILKMLQEKKISTSEAEKLLAALEA